MKGVQALRISYLYNKRNTGFFVSAALKASVFMDNSYKQYNIPELSI